MAEYAHHLQPGRRSEYRTFGGVERWRIRGGDDSAGARSARARCGGGPWRAGIVECARGAGAAPADVRHELSDFGDFLGGTADAIESSGTLESQPHVDSPGVPVRRLAHAVL